MRKSTHLQRAADAHLQRVGSDLNTFLDRGLARGQSFEALAAELHRVTSIPISPRTLRRWAAEIEQVAS